MLPYKTGTITLTNGLATVTGSGTLWLTNAQSGDILTIDNSTLYIITAISSDTALTLDRVYAETTVSAQTYTIMRISSGWGMPAKLAQAYVELTDQYRARWLAGQGPKGEKGDTMFNYRGLYIASLTYTPGQMVYKNQALYVCLTQATGKDPEAAGSTYWGKITAVINAGKEGINL
ncbi:MAG: hypothetical protein Q4D58_08785 [Synergistaceae bacterium]|nr:hypothetical protein [Synergistaceae bacterium]